MKKLFSIILVISLFLFSTAAVSFSGSRHGYRSYNTHHRAEYSHYRIPASRHYSRSNHFWPYLGAGILTGAVIGSAFSQPPRTRTVYYTRSPQVIVHQPQPIIVRQQFPPSTPPPELILRQVKITEKIVNIRSGPGLENTVINQVHHDERVDVVGIAPDWLYVKTADGQYGWIMAQYTLETDRPMG